MTEESTAVATVDPARSLMVGIEVQRAITRKLKADVPKQYTYQRAGPGGRMLTYIPWGYACRVLNDTFGPDWSHEYTTGDIQRIELEPLPAKPATRDKPARAAVLREEVMVTATLVTPWGRHTATAGHPYYPSNGEQLLSDAVQSAASKALTRAAARIGIGLDLRLSDGQFSDGLEDTPVGRAVVAVVDDFAEVCAEFGLTEGQAIALLSETITGDQNDLVTLADIMEAASYATPADVVGALRAAIAGITQEEEAPAPPKKPARKTRKAAR